MTSISNNREQQLTDLAKRLAQAWLRAGQIELPPDDVLPNDRTEAYFVQDAMAAEINQPLSGWKVGATSARMRELDGHDDVIPGRIFLSTTWQGADFALPIHRFVHARAETEFAFRLAEDLPVRDAPWTAEEITPCVTLHPAIEIIGNRHQLTDALPSVKSLMTIADNGGGIGFVFGNAVPDWQSLDFQQHVITLTVDGGVAAENFLGEMRCNPVQAVADLANHLQSRGIGLNAGDFVSTGAATVPQAIQAGSRVVADFGELGVIRLQFV